MKNLVPSRNKTKIKEQTWAPKVHAASVPEAYVNSRTFQERSYCFHYFNP